MPKVSWPRPLASRPADCGIVLRPALVFNWPQADLCAAPRIAASVVFENLTMTQQSPNVLVLFSDEHDPRHMGASGSPIVQTPNLDSLARRGTRFVNASTPSPICVPARASLATGLHVHDIGYWDNAIAYDGRVKGWGHAATEAGHRVESIGKLHYTRTQDPTGFSKEHHSMHVWKGIGQVWGAIRDPLPPGRSKIKMFNQIGPGLCNYNEFDQEVTQQAESWLHERAKAPEAKPWALFVGLVSPHFPLVAPEQYFEPYPVDRIEHSKLLPTDGFAWHPWIAEREAYMGQEHFFDGQPERRRLAIAAYFALCTFLDENVGRILRALEQSGQADTTLILYTSDHGDNIGQRALWGKSNLYRESTDVPMILAGPDVPAGDVNYTPVGLTDLHATILDALQVSDCEDDLVRPSKSLLELLHHKHGPRTTLSQYHAIGAPTGAFMVADGRYKYHYYVDYPAEMFDLRFDPEEANDLGAASEHETTRARLHAALIEHLGGKTPEQVDRMAKDDQNALVNRYGGPIAAMEVGTPAATPVPGKGHE